MQVNVVSFPGGKQTVNLPPGSTVRQALEAAKALPKEGDTVDLALDGEIADLDKPVTDGSTVTKTKRVAGG